MPRSVGIRRLVAQIPVQILLFAQVILWQRICKIPRGNSEELLQQMSSEVSEANCFAQVLSLWRYFGQTQDATSGKTSERSSCDTNDVESEGIAKHLPSHLVLPFVEIVRADNSEKGEAH